MKKVWNKPTTGQFVEVYEYKGELWSMTYRWQQGKLQIYCRHQDDWVTDDSLADDSLDITYLVPK